jgi:adenosylhomocysteine nucleosidase
VVVGLRAEGRIARKLGIVAIGGGTPAGAAAAASSLIARGAQSLISFGLAGALDPALRPGTLIIPRIVLTNSRQYEADATLLARATTDRILGGTAILATAAEKHLAWLQTGASAVDLESGAVAEIAYRQAIPFAVLRVICDPAERTLPPAALIALDQRGRIGAFRIMASLLINPGQLPVLLSLARDAKTAMSTLRQASSQEADRSV